MLAAVITAGMLAINAVIRRSVVQEAEAKNKERGWRHAMPS